MTREIEFEHHIYCPIDGLVDYDDCLGCDYFVEIDRNQEIVRCNYEELVVDDPQNKRGGGV